MFGRIFAIVCAGFALAAPSAGGIVDLSTKPNVRIVYEFYPIRGSSWNEIRESLKILGPQDGAGVCRFAFAKWYTQWKWDYPDNGRVDPDTVRITTDVTVLIPRLVLESPNNSLMYQWNLFVGKILLHEQQHVSHIMSRSDEILPAILRSRDKLGYITPIRAGEAAQRVLRRVRDLDEDYDARTIHGKREGIVVPGNE